MIHGESDETIPLSDVQTFAKKFHIPLTVVPNGDHRLSIPRAPEQVARLAADFFNSPHTSPRSHAKPVRS